MDSITLRVDAQNVKVLDQIIELKKQAIKNIEQNNYLEAVRLLSHVISLDGLSEGLNIAKAAIYDLKKDMALNELLENYDEC